MRFGITSDANEESGVGELVDLISGPTRRHFLSRDYGPGVLAVVVVLMCRNPDLNFHRRVRFSKKDRMFSMDVMLDLDEMKRALPEERKAAIFDRLLIELPAAMRKRSFADFDQELFDEDLNEWLAQLRGGMGGVARRG